jgi:hypothetical protein
MLYSDRKSRHGVVSSLSRSYKQVSLAELGFSQCLKDSNIWAFVLDARVEKPIPGLEGGSAVLGKFVLSQDYYLH